ncbi:DUF559 domain-containing protein [Microbacterium sp. BK668]|uniref:DUF559 domain-containing protein n=1 Tax=Microbacterium sp. BK668 TaxID=2512118 RepID=UPI00105FBDAE|nr:DUF559 domain-containing protein [Microbacterium sp. BK668]TDN88579.1 uncharacterized protein DUF559 [Microbacterium sp. BK668]
MPQHAALVTWIEARGGVAHTTEAVRSGHSRHHIAAAVAGGLLERVRRSWLVTPGCDERLRAAASVSGRLTCVSAASALGLWTPDHDLVHVAVARTASRLNSGGLRIHTARGPAPVGPLSTVDPVLNVLFHTARCLDEPDALAVWESAMRKRLVDAGMLEAVQWRSSRAAKLARVAGDLSDSGVETRFVDAMRTAGVEVQQQAWIDGHRVDGLIGRFLVVQLDGFAHHSSPRDRRRDLEADARLQLLGFTVLRFDYFQTLYRPQAVVDTVITAMSQGLHLRRRAA